MNLLKKQDQEIVTKHKNKTLLQKTCVIFSMQGKSFLMALKEKYFQQNPQEEAY